MELSRAEFENIENQMLQIQLNAIELENLKNIQTETTVEEMRQDLSTLVNPDLNFVCIDKEEDS